MIFLCPIRYSSFSHEFQGDTTNSFVYKLICNKAIHFHTISVALAAVAAVAVGFNDNATLVKFATTPTPHLSASLDWIV